MTTLEALSTIDGTPPSDPSRSRRRQPISPTLKAVLAIAFVATLVTGTLAVLGLRMAVVMSPSMGTTAPVGSLVISQGTTSDSSFAVGDVVTYRPPDAGSLTFTHRIVALVPGGFRTRGDINGSDDPWTVDARMVSARAVAILPGVGWLVRCGPWVALGLIAVWLLSAVIRGVRWRAATRLVGASAVLSAVIGVLHPIAGSQLLMAHQTAGGMSVTFASTGILPITLHAARGPSITLAPGEVGRLLVPATHGRIAIESGLGLDPIGWCLLAVACTIPILGVLVVGLPGADDRASGTAPTA